MRLSARFALAAAVCLTAAPALRADVAPYTTDANTLHLYHLNESNVPAVDSGSGTPINFDSKGTLSSFVTGFFGNAVSIGPADSSISAAGLIQSLGPGNTSTPAAWQGADGAFTYDMLIRTSSISNGDEIQLLTKQDDIAAYFQFRINGGNLQFVKATGTVDTATAVIPTTGKDAFVADEWFHVAVSYNGDPSDPQGVKLYWTRAAPGVTRANLIGVDGLNADVTSGTANRTVLGNRFNGSGENLPGTIDEVRASSVARTADQFVFSKNLALPIILTDNFTSVTSGINDNLAARQTGLAAVTNYSTGGSTSATIVNNQVFFDPAGSMTISPDLNLAAGAAAALIAAQGGFVVDFDVNPVSDASDTGTNTNWFALSFGHTSASRTTGNATAAVTSGSADFGILFRDNGKYQTFDNGVNKINDLIFDANPVATETYNIRIVVMTANANSGTGAVVYAFVNGVMIDLDPSAAFGGYAFTWDTDGSNFLALEARNNDAVFDNLVIAAVPTPAALPAGLALMTLITVRRRK
ncbi:MAG: hypothetical protein GC162_12415 [Planctomycetes bacterium]|nr:hypothetical protein [Planctomycetota bacterium]